MREDVQKRDLLNKEEDLTEKCERTSNGTTEFVRHKKLSRISE